MPSKKSRVPVTVRAVVQRINRRIEAEWKQLKRSRGAAARLDLGHFYVLDTKRKIVAKRNVDLEEFARHLGLLEPWEYVVESEGDA